MLRFVRDDSDEIRLNGSAPPRPKCTRGRRRAYTHWLSQAARRNPRMLRLGLRQTRGASDGMSRNNPRD